MGWGLPEQDLIHKAGVGKAVVLRKSNVKVTKIWAKALRTVVRLYNLSHKDVIRPYPPCIQLDSLASISRDSVGVASAIEVLLLRYIISMYAFPGHCLSVLFSMADVYLLPSLTPLPAILALYLDLLSDCLKDTRQPDHYCSSPTRALEPWYHHFIPHFVSLYHYYMTNECDTGSADSHRLPASRSRCWDSFRGDQESV
jgi:hypothetical protein